MSTYLCNERLALLNVLLELGQASFQQFLLLSRQVANGVDLLNTINLFNSGQHQENGHYETILTPSSTLEEKKSMPWSANNGLFTKVGVTTPFSPFKPRSSSWVNLAPAYAIESVALPAPSFAFTTSSPPNWMRCTRAAYASPATDLPWGFCDSRGTMVGPLWPPMTVIPVLEGEAPVMPATKRVARTTSSVVIPNRRAGLKTPAFSRVAATMGTVELTGLEMTRM